MLKSILQLILFFRLFCLRVYQQQGGQCCGFQVILGLFACLKEFKPKNNNNHPYSVYITISFFIGILNCIFSSAKNSIMYILRFLTVSQYNSFNLFWGCFNE